MKTKTQDEKKPQEAFRFRLSINEKGAPAELMAIVSEFLKLADDPANGISIVRYTPTTYSIFFNARLPKACTQLGRCSLRGGYSSDKG